VEYFNYLGSVINYARHTCEINFRIATKKAAFSKYKALYISKMDLNLRKKPV
jgi:hypothetical protein